MTPTLLNTYTNCPARAGFELDQRFNHLRRFGVRAALGRVAHKMLERRAAGGNFDVAWVHEETHAHNELRKVWAPAEPPTPSNWPGWALTRARLARGWPSSPSANELPPDVKAHFHTGVMTDDQPAAAPSWPLPWREQLLTDPSGRMRGRPDLVCRIDGSLAVIDYKTGVRQGIPDSLQRQQLLFYCALVRHVLGERPTMAFVQDAAGVAHAVHVSEPANDEVVSEAQVSLQTLQNSSLSFVELPAKPSAETCGSCPFRMLCNQFLDAYRPDWQCGQVRVGRIDSLTSMDGPSTANLRVSSPIWVPQHMILKAFPFPSSTTDGQYWGCSDFEGTLNTGFARWNTLVARWPEVS